MKKILIALCTVSLILTIGCEEFLNEGPLDEYSSASVYKSEADMIIATNQLYTYLPHPDMTNDGEARMWIYSDDGWRRNGGTNTKIDTWSSSTSSLTEFYQYDEIRDCNEIISRIPGIEFTTDGMAERLDAEARFMRAFIYERMAFFYGDVPLITEPQTFEDFPAKSSRSDVFDFVISELGAIANSLPESLDESGGRITKWAALALQARANLNAVGWHSNPASLYSAAQTALNQIITSSPHDLDGGVIGFKELFTAASDVGSKGVILARGFVEGLVFYDGLTHRCLPRGSWSGTGDGAGNNQAQYGATGNLIQAYQTINGLAPAADVNYDPADPFTDRDPRLRASFVLPGDMLQNKSNTGLYEFQPHPKLASVSSDRADKNTGIDTGYLIRKYSGLSLSDDITLEYENTKRSHADFKILRYAEVLLMMAETYASTGDEANTLLYINLVRDRVGMPSYTSIADVPLIDGVRRGTTGNDLIDAVLLERRYEFSGEGPQRFFDIWRYKLGDQVYGAVEGMPKDENLPGDLDGDKTTYAKTTRNWDDRFYLLPLPLDAFNVNENLGDNNPGW